MKDTIFLLLDVPALIMMLLLNVGADNSLIYRETIVSNDKAKVLLNLAMQFST